MLGGQIVKARAIDIRILGYNTFNTNNLRLWKSNLTEFEELPLDLSDEEYAARLQKNQDLDKITSFYFPQNYGEMTRGAYLTKKEPSDKEERLQRLRQEYFFASVTS